VNGSFGSKKSSFPKTKIDFPMSGLSFVVVLNVVPVIVLSVVLIDVVLIVVLDVVVSNRVVEDPPTLVEVVVVNTVVV